MSNKVRLTGMWEKTTKNGETYFETRLGGAYLQIFKNSYKEKETDPDWNVYLSEPVKKEENKNNS